RDCTRSTHRASRKTQSHPSKLLQPKRFGSRFNPWDTICYRRCSRNTMALSTGSWRFLLMERARVRVSPKFQIVIPKSSREELHIEPGQDLVMYSLEGTIRILPRRSIKELRGSAKGMRWKEDYRDHSDHF